MCLTQLGSGKSLNRFKKVANHIIEINRRYKRLSLKKQKDLGVKLIFVDLDTKEVLDVMPTKRKFKKKGIVL